MLAKAEGLLNKFDFLRVQKAMQHLGMSYGCEKQAPTIDRLREMAEYHLLRVLTNPDIYWSSGGGFAATRQGDTVMLLYALESWDMEAALGDGDDEPK